MSTRSYYSRTSSKPYTSRYPTKQEYPKYNEGKTFKKFTTDMRTALRDVEKGGFGRRTEPRKERLNQEEIEDLNKELEESIDNRDKKELQRIINNILSRNVPVTVENIRLLALNDELGTAKKLMFLTRIYDHYSFFKFISLYKFFSLLEPFWLNLKKSKKEDEFFEQLKNFKSLDLEPYKFLVRKYERGEIPLEIMQEIAEELLHTNALEAFYVLQKLPLEDDKLISIAKEELICPVLTQFAFKYYESEPHLIAQAIFCSIIDNDLDDLNKLLATFDPGDNLYFFIKKAIIEDKHQALTILLQYVTNIEALLDILDEIDNEEEAMEVEITEGDVSEREYEGRGISFLTFRVLDKFINTYLYDNEISATEKIKERYYNFFKRYYDKLDETKKERLTIFY